jgi:uncharacterized OsmC-like protein
MSTITVRNGVNVNQLVETVQAVQQNPDLARFEFRAHNRWEGGGRSLTTVTTFFGAGSEQRHTQPHTLVGDEPAVLLGGDSGANAVEAVLASLASCLAVGYAYNAAAQGIDLEALEFELTGYLDLHAFLGLGGEARPGFQNIQVRCRTTSSVARERLIELCDYVQRTSPVVDILRNPVPVAIELVE